MHVLATPLQPHRRFVASLVAVAVATAIAGCGSGSKPTGTVAAKASSRLAFAKCMRSHAVPNFPDGPNIPDGITESPAFQSAAQACRGKLRPGDGPHGISASTKLRLLHHAQCMRAHGVPHYPDPHIPSHGPYDFGSPPGIDTDAPAFKSAAAACGGA